MAGGLVGSVWAAASDGTATAKTMPSASAVSAALTTELGTRRDIAPQCREGDVSVTDSAQVAPHPPATAVLRSGHAQAGRTALPKVKYVKGFGPVT